VVQGVYRGVRGIKVQSEAIRGRGGGRQVGGWERVGSPHKEAPKSTFIERNQWRLLYIFLYPHREGRVEGGKGDLLPVNAGCDCLPKKNDGRRH
jgi:hypothetical protein